MWCARHAAMEPPLPGRLDRAVAVRVWDASVHTRAWQHIRVKMPAKPCLPRAVERAVSALLLQWMHNMCAQTMCRPAGMHSTAPRLSNVRWTPIQTLFGWCQQR
jgi:hypothetical protein